MTVVAALLAVAVRPELPLRELGAISQKVVSRGPQFSNRERGYDTAGGLFLSADGRYWLTMAPTNYYVAIDLATGADLWHDLPRSGLEKSTGRQIIATQSQWGWIPSRENRAAGNPDWKLGYASYVEVISPTAMVAVTLDREDLPLGKGRPQHLVKSITATLLDMDARGSRPNNNITYGFRTPERLQHLFLNSSFTLRGGTYHIVKLVGNELRIGRLLFDFKVKRARLTWSSSVPSKVGGETTTIHSVDSRIDKSVLGAQIKDSTGYLLVDRSRVVGKGEIGRPFVWRNQFLAASPAGIFRFTSGRWKLMTARYRWLNGSSSGSCALLRDTQLNQDVLVKFGRTP